MVVTEGVTHAKLCTEFLTGRGRGQSPALHFCVFCPLRGAALEALRRLEHILRQDAVPPGGIIHQDVGDSAHQASVLKDGAAAHE